MKTFLITILATVSMLFSVSVSSHEYGHYHEHPNRHVDRTGRPYYTCPTADCYNRALGYNPYYQYHNYYVPRGRPNYHVHGHNCGHYYNRRSHSWIRIGVSVFDPNFGTTIYFERNN